MFKSGMADMTDAECSCKLIACCEQDLEAISAYKSETRDTQVEKPEATIKYEAC